MLVEPTICSQSLPSVSRLKLSVNSGVSSQTSSLGETEGDSELLGLKDEDGLNDGLLLLLGLKLEEGLRDEDGLNDGELLLDGEIDELGLRLGEFELEGDTEGLGDDCSTQIGPASKSSN